MLISSDWHLTQAPADSYRWKIFSTMRKLARKYKQDTVYILGDITDKKDRHPAQLVNKVVDHLEELASHVKVKIITGNHDYIDPSLPFFSFLRHLDNVKFYTTPTVVKDEGMRILLIPHTKDLDSVIEEYGEDFSEYGAVFMHHTVDGAITSNGTKLKGTKFAPTKSSLVVSGDIHVPQVCKGVVYVGAPYPVRFGDTYSPRVLMLNDGKLKSICIKHVTKAKVTLQDKNDLEELVLEEGDQAKVTIVLTNKNKGALTEIKTSVEQWCKDSGVLLSSIAVDGSQLFGTNRVRLRGTALPQLSKPDQVMVRYATRERVSKDVLAAGMELLGEANDA